MSKGSRVEGNYHVLAEMGKLEELRKPLAWPPHIRRHCTSTVGL